MFEPEISDLQFYIALHGGHIEYDYNHDQGINDDDNHNQNGHFGDYHVQHINNDDSHGQRGLNDYTHVQDTNNDDTHDQIGHNDENHGRSGHNHDTEDHIQGGERIAWEFHHVTLQRVPGYGFGIAVSVPFPISY